MEGERMKYEQETENNEKRTHKKLKWPGKK
jgi:hypothetical protein